MSTPARAPFASLDPGTLGVFRVLLAAVIAVDLLRHPPVWSASPVGVALGALSLVCFGLGFRTRLFQALLWLGVAVPGLLAGARGTLPVLELMLTWTLLVPLGARFSVDALRASLAARTEVCPAELAERAAMAGPSAPIRSLGTVAIWTQLIATAGLVATGRLSAELTPALLVLVGAILPLGPALARRAGRRASDGPTLECFFDADCGICFQLARLLARMDRLGQVELLSNRDAERLPEGVTAELIEETIVVRDIARDRRYTRATAIAVLCRALPLGWPAWALLSLPGLGFLWNGLYDLVARNRRRISTALGMAACRLPDPSA